MTTGTGTEGFSLGAEEVQQTILILNLSVAQIDLSITEGDHSVNALIDSFTYMSKHIEEIQKSSEGIFDLVADNEAAQAYNALLTSETAELANKMQQAIIAFQFYDKLSQRLNHVSHGLSGLAEIVSHEMRVNNREEWEAFKKSVRKGTTMREEEELFELIFDQHLPVEEAIDIMCSRMRERMNEKKEESVDEDEIELF
ncbi:hypothetical protein QCB45_03875 [Thiomicrorhabdus sp. ZW0627]|uniref:hypothetical protein n=1 Tax=Thiomicrorhabdus sp. ZW0627 TaxID=3039774 RepID=UPI002436AEB8|nr:hypothetical protein [Thiomicrorhabdus sp. ZW0627]MDG6773459.1 hypothetical protein [Thiomicrorhabdus sp. ZW0627]